jgi:4-hydroxy-tetrahydrodipicolinate synthase
MKKLCGVIAPMITPMTDKGEVDYGSMENLTTHLISRGVSALYPCGTTGEVNNLTIEEREKLAEVVCKAAGGKVPVFVQAGGTTTAVAVRLAKHALKHGADGVGMLTPMYYPLSDEELFEFYTTVSRSVPSDFPIYLYGIPGCAVNRIGPVLLEKIADTCPNVQGIKYSVDEILTLMAFHRVRNGTFSVMVAPVQMLLPALSIGCEGVVSGNCNVFVEDLAAMFAVFEEGDIKKCRVIQERLAVLAAELSTKEAAKCKALLKRAGILTSDAMRSPQKGLNNTERKELFAFVEKNYTAYKFG